MSGTTPISDLQNIAVVGAGIIGLSCALAFANRGQRVTIYESQWPPRGASWAAAGMLAPAYEAAMEDDGHPRLFDLCLASADLWPDFAAALRKASGIDVDHRPGPTFVVPKTTAENTDIEVLYLEKLAGQVDSDWLTKPSFGKLDQELNAEIETAIRLDGDASVDNRAVLNALIKSVEPNQNIAVVEERAELAGRLQDDGKLDLHGVAAAGTVHRHNTVLLATGAAGPEWSAGRGTNGPMVHLDPSDLENVTHIRLSYEEGVALLDQTLGCLSPVRGQAISIAPFEGAPTNVIRWTGGYIVPKNDRIIIGATSEPGEADPMTQADAVRQLKAAAAHICPAIADQPITEAWAGIRPKSPDGAPILGKTQIDRLFIASGHYRNGILLAPITAEIMAEMIIDGRTSHLAAAFSPDRFR